MSGRWIGCVRWTRSWQRTAEPLVAGSVVGRVDCQSTATAVVGRAGWLRGGRRESIHGGLSAASMPQTPPRTHPARPVTISVRVQPRKRKRKAKADRVAALAPVSTNGRHLPRAVQYAVPADRGKLSKAGRCGLAGCEPHGCGDQAPMDGFTASPQAHSAPPPLRKPALDLDVAPAGAGRQPCKEKPNLSNEAGLLPVPGAGTAP